MEYMWIWKSKYKKPSVIGVGFLWSIEAEWMEFMSRYGMHVNTEMHIKKSLQWCRSRFFFCMEVFILFGNGIYVIDEEIHEKNLQRDWMSITYVQSYVFKK